MRENSTPSAEARAAVRSLTWLERSCAATALVYLLASPAVAQTTRYWAPDAGAGGSGTWNTTDLFWAPNADGSGTKVAWDSSLTNNRAHFGGTAGTVTTGAAVSTNQIRFDTTGYLLAGDATNSITLNGTTPQVLLAGGVAAEISAVLAGSAGISTGATGTTGGTLTLSGTSSLTGTALFGAGEVVLATGGSLTAGTLAAGTGVAGATSTLRIKSGAAFSASAQSTIGTNTRFTAAVIQEGGTATFGNGLLLGTNGSTTTYTGSSSYTLEGGSLDLTSTAAGFMTVGRNSTATFTQTGGTVILSRTIDALTIGDFSTGSYSITAGSLTMIGDPGSNAQLGFRGGSGTLDIGGTAAVRIRGSLFLAVNQLNSATTKGSATVNLQGGDLAVNGITRGRAGTTGSNGAGSVSFTLSGGTLRPYGADATFGSATAGNNFDITLSGSAAAISGLDASATPVARSVDLYANLIGSGGVTLSGGTLTLHAANTHAGPTTITPGTSVALLGSIANSSAVTVNGSLDLATKTTGFAFGSGQTLGGAGTVALPTTGPGVSLAGFLAPGNSPGSLTLSGAGTFDITSAINGTTGRLLFELGTPNVVAASDFVLIPDGTLSIGTNLLGFDSFAFTPLAGFTAGTYSLFSANTISGLLDPARTTGSVGGLSAELTASSTEISLIVVPEPPAIGLFALGIGAAGIALRRRWAAR